MSEPLSRRDLFAFLASPLTRVARSISADEQRRRNLQAIKQMETPVICERCHAPFPASAEETTCPTCRDAEAKNRALIQSLYKHA